MSLNPRLGGPWAATFLLACISAALSGCQALGVAASAVPQSVKAAYPGLRGQRVAIMVWADHAIITDNPTLQPDLAKALQSKLQEAADADIDEVRNIQFARVDDILRFQEDHPELQSESARAIATRLPVPATRLIYLEVADLSLHPNETVDLSRGSATLNLTVVEIAGSNPKVAYEEQNVSVVYPPKSPPEGLPGLQDAQVYHHLIDALSTALATRFVTHEADKEAQ